MDDLAIAAGAKNHFNYTDMMILYRFELRTHAEGIKDLLPSACLALAACSPPRMAHQKKGRALRGGVADSIHTMLALPVLSVLSALEYAWTACLSAGAIQNGLMNYESYSSMFRRLYLVLRIEEAAMKRSKAARRVILDSSDCKDTIRRDFLSDSKGKPYLTMDDFFDCLFELADLCARAIS